MTDDLEAKPAAETEVKLAEESGAEPAQSWFTPGMVAVLFVAFFAAIAAWQGSGGRTDRLDALKIIGFLTALALAFCKAPWWGWLFFLPVLLIGGCTALFACCFRWQGG